LLKQDPIIRNALYKPEFKEADTIAAKPCIENMHEPITNNSG